MVTFDPERHRDRMEESRRRLVTARAFREPDRVPITISTAGSFYCRLFGVNLRDYFRDAFGSLDLQCEVQVRGLKWAFEELQDDRTSCGIHLDVGPIQEALLFDLPIEYPDDTSPWIVRTMSVPEAKDLYGDFATARPAVGRALSIGMPGGGYALAVGGETYAGVNPDTLCQVVAYARKAGRYGVKTG